MEQIRNSQWRRHSKVDRKSIGLEYVDLCLIHTSNACPQDRAAIWKGLEEVNNKQIELHYWLQQCSIVVQLCFALQ
jgi:diketogulonate reductase-like aldo/keto reductase